GVALEQRLQHLHGLRLASGREIQPAQRDVAGLERRILSHASLEHRNRAVDIVARREHEREVVGGLAVAGPLLDGLPEERLRAIELSLAAVEDADVVER